MRPHWPFEQRISTPSPTFNGGFFPANIFSGLGLLCSHYQLLPSLVALGFRLATFSISGTWFRAGCWLPELSRKIGNQKGPKKIRDRSSRSQRSRPCQLQ